MKGPMYIEKNLSFKRYRQHCNQILFNKIEDIKKRRRPFFFDNNTIMHCSNLRFRGHAISTIRNIVAELGS